MKIIGLGRIFRDLNLLLGTLLGICLFTNIGSLVIYQFSNMKSDFYHEAAYPLLYAVDILDTKLFFSSDFSGREIAPISWPIIYSLLLLFGLETSFTTVAIGNLLFLLFAITVLLCYGKTFRLRRTQILLVLVLFTTPWGVRPFRYTWIDQVWIWPMNSYGVYEIFSLLLCILSFRMLQVRGSAQSSWKFIVCYKYYLFVFFIFGLNHNRGILEIYGPIGFTLSCLAVFAYIRGDSNFLRRNLQVFVTTLVATLIGRTLIGIATLGVPQYYQQPSQQFTLLDHSNFLIKLMAPLLTIFQVFGMNPAAGMSIVSLHGLRIFGVSAIVCLVVYFPIFRYIRSTHFERISLSAKFMFLHLLYFVFVSFVTSLFTNSAGVVRYLIPLAISAIFFLPFMFSEIQKKQVVFTLFITLLILPSVASGAVELNDSKVPSYRETSNYKLTESLLKRNLRFGYAGPWTEDVLVIPFYSEGKIQISLIDVNPLGPHLHADKSWFRDGSHSGKTFIAVPSASLPQDENFAKLLSISSSQYKVGKWTVLIFQYNPSNFIGNLAE